MLSVMMRYSWLMLVFTTFTMAHSDNSVYFKKSAFSIAPLEAKTKAPIYTILTMYLPASEGFSPNVNVMKQRFNGSIKDYMKLSRQQFAQIKLEVKSEQESKNSVIWEYTGQMKGIDFHWYAKATLVNGTVYLATGSAKKNQWEAVQEALKASVDSLKME